MNSDCTLVLQLLSDGLINVEQAERLITRIKRLTRLETVRLRKNAAWAVFVPPHFSSGFGAQSTVVAA